MSRISLGTIVAVALCLFWFATSAMPQQPAGKPPSQQAASPRQFVINNQRWTGDFDRMLERRVVRILVPFSRSLYFDDRGHERGIAAELGREFERYVNRKYRTDLGKRPLTVFMIVTTRDRLLADVAAGLGDIAVGNLTVTPEREALVDFVAPADRAAVSELLVTGPSSPPIAGIDDLAGATVHVRKSSSYYESLVALNDRLRSTGRQPVNIVLVPDALEDEDMMEMVNAGLLNAIVVDDWKARMWAQVLPKLRVRDDVVLRSDGRTGWAIRKESPRLAAEIDEFYRKFAQPQRFVENRVAHYTKLARQLKNPGGTAEYKRFEATVALFRKYGTRYNFDPLMLAAQGFQESRLDQNARSAVGAVGIMQVMPRTGAELGVGDIQALEPNIHAGAKYLDRLMSGAFSDAHFDEENRTLFAFASYNCGPGNVSKARREAAKRGLDPDRWFNNVEVVVAERIGMETTTYVRNIYKYYVAYRLASDARAAIDKAREQVAPGKG